MKRRSRVDEKERVSGRARERERERERERQTMMNASDVPGRVGSEEKERKEGKRGRFGGP